MRTVKEDRTGLDDKYEFDESKIVYDAIVPQRKSCFYDFGARRRAGFSGFSSESESDFVKSVRADFFD